MDLPKRPLGSSGVPITAVGFGAWALGAGAGGSGWDRKAKGARLQPCGLAWRWALNGFIRVPVYGLGHSEEVVGRLLRELSPSERPMVFTKCGLVWDEDNPMAEPKRNLKPESIQRECDASLRRLGVDRIDLYQFHWPDDTGTPVEES